jgi:hypothetical protein
MKISKVTRISLTSKLKQHPLYKSAKNGSMSDAQILVSDIVPDSTVFSRLRGFVCPVVKSFGNKIPYALAYYLEQHSNLILWPYVELEHEKHGSSMAERILYKPCYSGPVMPGNYILVDDVFTSGKTLMGLKRYIEANGGNVIAVYVIGSSAGLSFEPDKYLLKTLLHRFPEVRKMIDVELLTNPQVLYLLRYTDIRKFIEIQNCKLLESYNFP